MRVLFTLVDGPFAEWEHEFVPTARKRLERQKDHRYEWTDTPDSADLIVFFETVAFKTQRYISALLNNRFLREFPNKCFTINYEDSPAGFLPGLYASLPKSKYEPLRHRSWNYVFWPVEHLIDKGNAAAISPRLLFSFRGSARSYPLRKQMLDQEFISDFPLSVRDIDRWFDHTPQEKADYIDEILDSYFCLCPRGIGTTSHRLFEVMALGRCPVILSDEWVPIPGIDWDSCSIRIPESEWKSIPDILESRLADAPAMGDAAKRAWESRFSPEKVLGEALDQINEIAASRPADYDDRHFQKQWNTRAFYKKNGWLFEQRVARKLSATASRIASTVRRGPTEK